MGFARTGRRILKASSLARASLIVEPRLWLLFAIGLGAWALYSNRRLETPVELIQPGNSFRVPGGWTRSGVRVPAPVDGDIRCHLLRYTSSECPYCDADRSVFRDLHRDASTRGCRTLILSPTPDVSTDEGLEDTDVLTEVDGVSASDLYRLLGTPTTIVADRHFQIVWSHLGSLQSADARQAAAAMKAIN